MGVGLGPRAIDGGVTEFIDMGTLASDTGLNI